MLENNEVAKETDKTHILGGRVGLDGLKQLNRLSNRCDLCNRQLKYRAKAQGYVCKNWKCVRYYKLTKGYVFNGDSVRFQEGEL